MNWGTLMISVTEVLCLCGSKYSDLQFLHHQNYQKYICKANYIDHNDNCLMSVYHVKVVFPLSLTILLDACINTYIHTMNKEENLRESEREVGWVNQGTW